MDERKCWLCGRNGSDDPLETHHIFFGPLRKKSDRYGLVVYLCGNRCHREGPRAVHKCRDTRDELMRWGQEKAMKEQGWSVEEFRREFGKNYL